VPSIETTRAMEKDSLDRISYLFTAPKGVFLTIQKALALMTSGRTIVINAS
jgi:hypothetical protein